jgi:hypothetical protein
MSDQQAHKAQSDQQGRKEMLAQLVLQAHKEMSALLDHREFKAYKACKATSGQRDPRAQTAQLVQSDPLAQQEILAQLETLAQLDQLVQ